MSRAAGETLLAFRIGEARAALPLALIREVVDCPPIVPVPGCHPHVAGVVLSSGIAVPVYDLRRLPAFWRSRPEETHIDDEPASLIIVGYGEALVALLGAQADLLDALDVDPGETDEGSIEGPIRTEFVSGHLKQGASSVARLDPDRLFASLGVPADGLAALGGLEGGRG